MEQIEETIIPETGKAVIFQHQIRHYDAVHTAPFAARYAELGQRPTQILWGAEDAWQVVDWAHKLHAALRNTPDASVLIWERSAPTLAQMEPLGRA